MTTSRGPVLLAILDGWGIGRDEPGNAVLAANTPVMDRLLTTYPHATLRCSGEDVGLPDRQMGNSEVGHLNIGAGFVVYQWITRINRAIVDGEFARNAALLDAFTHTKQSGGTVHLLGLVGNGGVHAHSHHLLALLDLAEAHDVDRLSLHLFTDGRDTSPTSGLRFVEEIEHKLAELEIGRIASVLGRYYAMDRDRRWERVKLAFDAIVHGRGPVASSASGAVRTSYDRDVTDEFIVPTVIERSLGEHHEVRSGDSLIFFNFRSDRARQLTRALALPEFDGFDRGTMPGDLHITTMTSYENDLPVAIAFPPQDVQYPLARVISEAGLRQFHTAETEKYAHVTFFLNGGREDPFPGEDRTLVPSPKVATYDLRPEMSAHGVRDAVLGAIRSSDYAFIIVNFANGDMVGHSGVFGAAVEAIETVDACLGEIVAALIEADGVGLITADHGNAEEMIDRHTGGPMTAHTTNPVPLVLVAPDDHPLRHVDLRIDGVLSAVAPTILGALGLSPHPDMTLPSLIVPA